MQKIDGNTRTFTVGAALAAYRRVRLSAGVLAYAGASDVDSVGVTTRETFASGETVAVDLHSKAGTVEVEAAGAFSVGATLYAAANGRVDDSGTVIVGIALAAASGAGSVIEVMLAKDNTQGTTFAEHAVQLTDLRVHDAFHTNLPGTAANDDLALVGGTFGSGAPHLRGVDFGGTSTTAYARFLFQLPADYAEGGDVTVRLRGGMLTSVGDGACTVDLVCHKCDDDGGVGSDICATAAQSIKSTTIADKDFTITPTGLVAGDVLDMRITVAGNDTANADVMIPVITKITVLADIAL